jgi:hypothetical protein
MRNTTKTKSGVYSPSSLNETTRPQTPPGYSVQLTTNERQWGLPAKITKSPNPEAVAGRPRFSPRGELRASAFAPGSPPRGKIQQETWPPAQLSLHELLQPHTTKEGTRMSAPVFSLQGQTAVVTGCTRGIGQAVAVGLAEAGADVILVQVYPPAAFRCRCSHGPFANCVIT